MTNWQSALEAVAADYTRGTLERDARAISEAYRLKTGEGKRLLTRESEAAAYALSDGRLRCHGHGAGPSGAGGHGAAVRRPPEPV